MDKTKTLKKPRKQPKKSMKINGIELVSHDPSAIFKNHKEIKLALSEALIDGDKEAFVDILSGYVRAHNILEVLKLLYPKARLCTSFPVPFIRSVKAFVYPFSKYLSISWRHLLKVRKSF